MPIATLDEVRALAPEIQRVLRDLTGEVGALQAELAAAQQRLAEAEALADRDALTGVLNRRGFGRELKRAAALASRHGAPASVIYLDLDGFKALNDTLGHQAGDAALVQVARLLEGNIRETDAVGRLGGDEFALLLAHADVDAAAIKAERLRALLDAQPFMHEGRTARLGGSFGVRGLTRGLTAERALADADAAMYADKRARRLKAVRL